MMKKPGSEIVRIQTREAEALRRLLGPTLQVLRQRRGGKKQYVLGVISGENTPCAVSSFLSLARTPRVLSRGDGLPLPCLGTEA